MSRNGSPEHDLDEHPDDAATLDDVEAVAPVPVVGDVHAAPSKPSATGSMRMVTLAGSNVGCGDAATARAGELEGSASGAGLSAAPRATELLASPAMTTSTTTSAAIRREDEQAPASPRDTDRPLRTGSCTIGDGTGRRSKCSG